MYRIRNAMCVLITAFVFFCLVSTGYKESGTQATYDPSISQAYSRVTAYCSSRVDFSSVESQCSENCNQ